MYCGLSRAALSAPKISVRTMAYQPKLGSLPPKPYQKYAERFGDIEPRPAHLHWKPVAGFQTPPTSTDYNQHSIARIAKAAIGAGAQTVASYLPSLLAPFMAALGASGLLFGGASGIFRFFGSKKH